MVRVGSVAGNCAGMDPHKLDVVLTSKSTAMQLCADCPLQYSCIATLVMAHDRRSCMGGLNREERNVLRTMISQALHKPRLSLRDVEQYVRTHPEVIARARDEYRRRKRRDANSRRRRQYTREYMRGMHTITSMAPPASIVLHY